MLILFPYKLLASEMPIHFTDAVWYTNNKTGHSEMSVDITVQKDDFGDHYFYAHTIYLNGKNIENNEPNIMYAGFQNKGWSGEGWIEKMAIFSVWGAYEGKKEPNGWGTEFGGEGTGYSVRIPFEWNVGKTYRLTIKVEDKICAWVVNEAYADVLKEYPNDKKHFYVVMGDDGRCEYGHGLDEKSGFNDCEKHRKENDINGECKLFAIGKEIILKIDPDLLIDSDAKNNIFAAYLTDLKTKSTKRIGRIPVSKNRGLMYSPVSFHEVYMLDNNTIPSKCDEYSSSIVTFTNARANGEKLSPNIYHQNNYSECKDISGYMYIPDGFMSWVHLQ